VLKKQMLDVSDNPEERSKIVVCTVGKETSESLPLIINKLKPEIVYALCGEEQIDVVVSVLSILRGIKYKLILVDDKDPREITQKVFHTFNYLINRFMRDKIFLDATAGNRLLCSLATSVACIFGIKTFFTIKEDGAKMLEVSNPFEKYGLVLMSQAVNLYSHHFYRASMEIFAQIRERATEITLGMLSSALSMLSQAYMAWDQFIYKGENGAYTMLRQLSKELSKIKQFIKYAAEMKGVVDHNLHFLGNLLGSTKGGKEISPFLILDIFMNGKRRFEESRFDEAVIRFYRCVEGSVQYRLARHHSIDPSSPSLEKLGDRKLKRYLKLIGKTVPPLRLSLFDGYVLLRKILKDKFALKLREKDLKALMYSRNHSILSHGLGIVDHDVALAFMKRTARVIEVLFAEENIDIESAKSDAKFLELRESNVYAALST